MARSWFILYLFSGLEVVSGGVAEWDAAVSGSGSAVLRLSVAWAAILGEFREFEWLTTHGKRLPASPKVMGIHWLTAEPYVIRHCQNTTMSRSFVYVNVLYEKIIFGTNTVKSRRNDGFSGGAPIRCFHAKRDGCQLAL